MEDKILIINVLATTKITNVSDLVKKKKKTDYEVKISDVEKKLF